MDSGNVVIWMINTSSKTKRYVEDLQVHVARHKMKENPDKDTRRNEGEQVLPPDMFEGEQVLPPDMFGVHTEVGAAPTTAIFGLGAYKCHLSQSFEKSGSYGTYQRCSCSIPVLSTCLVLSNTW